MTKAWDDVEKEFDYRMGTKCKSTEGFANPEEIKSHYRTAFYQIMSELRVKIEKKPTVFLTKGMRGATEEGNFICKYDVLSLLPKERK